MQNKSVSCILSITLLLSVLMTPLANAESVDDCPNTPIGTQVDSNGCPEEEDLEPGNGSADGGDVNNATEEYESDYDAEAGLIPGFGSVLGVSALLGAAFYRRRRFFNSTT